MLRSSARTAPLKSEPGEPRKGRRSRRSWRTCSCTTRSICGWPGTSRAARLSATPTTRSCTARRFVRRIRAEQDHRADGRGRAQTQPGEDADRLLQGRSAPGEHEHTSVTFLGYAFRARGARGTKSGRAFTGFLPAISPEALKAKGVELRRTRIHR